MSTRMRLIVSGSLALLLALTGCGPKEGAKQAKPTATRSSSDIELNYVSTVQLSSREYHAELMVLQGDLRKPEPAMDSWNMVFHDQCKLDLNHDAVVPYAIRLTNKTDGPPLHFMPMWGISRQNADSTGELAQRVEIAETYVAGSPGKQNCVVWNQDNKGSSWVRTSKTSPMKKGSTMNVRGFIILHNYYGPQHPDGDVEAARHVVLGIRNVGVGREYLSGGALLLEMSSPDGGMHKLSGDDDLRYGVSLVPSETDKNCLFPENGLQCP